MTDELCLLRNSLRYVKQRDSIFLLLVESKQMTGDFYVIGNFFSA